MSRIYLAFVLTLVMSASASAVLVTKTLTFDPASETVNSLDLTIDASYSIISASDTQTVTVLSNSTMQVRFDYDFDPTTHYVTGVNSIEFIGGSFHLSDTTFTLDFILAEEYINSTNVGGTFDTSVPPGTITNTTGGSTTTTTTTFPTEEHIIRLNTGTLVMTGASPYTHNLASNPVEATTVGTSTFVTTLTSVVGGVANYSVEMTMPINFESDVPVDDPMTATISGEGTFVARGTFSIEPDNYAPVANDDYYEIDQDHTLITNANSGVRANDTDADGDTLSCSLYNGMTTSHGALMLGSTGWFRYTPNAGFSGTDSFSYRVYDGQLYSDPATVLINVLSAVEIPGDATGDGQVDADDLAILADFWGEDASGFSQGDFNGDGKTNAADAALLAANWGYGVSESNGEGVPEPGFLAMLFGGMAVLALRRRAR